MFLAKSDDIKRLDKLASEKYGIPVDVLMENAGRAIYDEIQANFLNKCNKIFITNMNIIQTYIKIVLPFFFKKRYNVFSHLCFFHK